MIIGTVGLAVDYGRATNAKSKLQSLVDAAGLAGAVLMGEDHTAAKKAAEEFAEQSLPKFTDGSVKIKVSIEGDSLKVTADTTVPTTFMQVLGFKTMPLQAVAVASSLTTPVDIFIVADMSSSMGIGADATERAKLKAMTKPYMSRNSYLAAHHPDGCTFACHNRLGVEPDGKTFREMARTAGIRLREDVVNEAVDALIDATLDPSLAGVRAGALKIGIIGFSDQARWVEQLTGDKARLKGQMARFPASERVSTRADRAMPWVRSEVAALKTNGKPQKMVLVTDGVSGDWPSERWSPYEASWCDAIKAEGIELYVIETIYEEERGDYAFDRHVAGFYSEISPTLKSCASANAHFVASSPAEIAKAFAEVAKKIAASKARLTN